MHTIDGQLIENWMETVQDVTRVRNALTSLLTFTLIWIKEVSIVHVILNLLNTCIFKVECSRNQESAQHGYIDRY